MEVPGENAPHSALKRLYSMRTHVHGLDGTATELRQRLDAQADRLKKDVEEARSLEQSVTRLGNAAPSSSATAAQAKQTEAVQTLKRQASKSSPSKEAVLGNTPLSIT